MDKECNFDDMDTCLDSVYQHLHDQNISNDIIDRFRQFILSEGYESVPLELHIQQQHRSGGNISSYMNDTECIELLISNYTYNLNKIRGIYVCICSCLYMFYHLIVYKLFYK